jgi:acyl dehydratase
MTVAPAAEEAVTPTDVVTLPAMPKFGGLYARGAASSGRIAAGRAMPSLPVLGAGPDGGGPLELPAVVHELAEFATDSLGPHLRDYSRLIREFSAEHLPSGYLHVLSFPLAMSVMVRPDFPLPLLGMVHLANDAVLSRPVSLGEPLTVRAWAQGLRGHRRGAAFDVIAEVAVVGDDTPAWRGVSTYLVKGFNPSVISTGLNPRVEQAEGRPLRPEALEGSKPPPDNATDRARGRQLPWTPPLPTSRWALPANTGRAYAAISGDRNPIHLSALSAKAFGFPRAIAHGMYTAARALAEVGRSRGETYRWTVDFAKPVLLPSTVDLAITPAADTPGFTFLAWNAAHSAKHFDGAVIPL